MKLFEERKILYEKRGKSVEYTLWKEPNGKVHLQILYKNFSKPVLKDIPCQHLGNGKYKCKNITIDTVNKKTIANITIPDALHESPVLNEIGNFIKGAAIKTVMIGIITGVGVYAITKIIDTTVKEVFDG